MPLFAQLLGQQAVQNLSIAKEQASIPSLPLQLMVQSQYVPYPQNATPQPYDEILDQLSNKSPIKDEYLDVTPYISMSQVNMEANFSNTRRKMLPEN